MKIALTEEQYAELRKDHYLEIIINEATKQNLYFEFNDAGAFNYGEINQKGVPGYPRGFYFDDGDLKKIIPAKPTDPSWYHNEPLCPNCGAYMLYHYECCPKCGQTLDWRERD